MTELLTRPDRVRSPHKDVGAGAVQRVVEFDRGMQPDTTETITPDTIQRQIEKLAFFNYQRSVFHSQQYGNGSMDYQAFVTRTYDETGIEEILEIFIDYNMQHRAPGVTKTVKGTMLIGENQYSVEIEGERARCFSLQGSRREEITHKPTIESLMFMLGERMAVAEGKRADRTDDQRLVADTDAFQKIATIMPTLAATTKH